MKRLSLLVILVLTSCGDADFSGNAVECFSIEDCPASLVCFLGACVDPNYSISSVYAEITPPASSHILPQPYPEPLSLSAGVQDLRLSAALVVAGTVAEANSGNTLPGLLVASRPSPIPGREILRQTNVSDAGYTLSVLPGEYTLRFVPTTEAPGRPPVSFWRQALVSVSQWNLTYPASHELVTVRGRVRYTEEFITKVEGATVRGTALGADGHPLDSTTTLTDASGNYELTFPPGATSFDLQVGPGTNTLVPDTLLTGLMASGPDNTLPDITLGVSQAVSVATSVQDGDGNPVARASVVFDGAVGQGHFTSSGSTGALGNVERSLWPGTYIVTVAPAKTDPWALSTEFVDVTAAGDPLTLVVGAKVRVTGVVRAQSGAGVGDAEINLNRRGVPMAREFTGHTAADGSFAVEVDPGDALGDAEYELTVQPSLNSRLPYYRELVRVGPGGLAHDVTLYDATLAAGRVRDPNGSAIADAVVTFFSVELGTATSPLLVGVGKTNSFGEFVVPLPTLAD